MSPDLFQNPFLTPAKAKATLWHWLLFLVSTIGAGALYFVWRPPAPMLFLHHEEILSSGSPNSRSAKNAASGGESGNDSGGVAITIDDAPHPLTTPLLLAALKRADVKATFFCVGESLRLYPELAYRIVREGHHLANHSQPHHNLTTVPAIEFPQHIDACFEQINRVGQDAKVPTRTRLFRPPGGGLDRDVMNYLYQRDFTLAWWSVNVGDWTCPPAWKIADGVKANLKAGDILLLHDGGTGTPQAIPAIVKAARAHGLHFVLMPEK